MISIYIYILKHPVSRCFQSNSTHLFEFVKLFFSIFFTNIYLPFPGRDMAHGCGMIGLQRSRALRAGVVYNLVNFVTW